jgi:type 2 lantibiotic biosynthesis protein LanM
MELSYDLNRMIMSAASLSERIASGVYEDNSAIDEDLAASRWAAWCEKSAQGSTGNFERRLSWENLDVASARHILSSDPLQLKPAPFWAPLLGDMLDFLTQPGGTPDFDEKILASRPFAGGLAPLVKFGMLRLEDQVGVALLPEPVAACLRVSLLDRIAGVCDLTLGEEFLRFRSDRGWTPGDGEGKKELYTAFIGQLARGGLVEILARYPVLARLLAIAIARWAIDIAAFLLRLESDRTGIARRFFEGQELGPVRSIHSSLSDPHRGGRTVKIVEFEDRRKIVYKPKSLAIDEAWLNLVAWLRQRERTMDLRAPLVWNGGEYGWVEYIGHAACESRDAVHNFYRRAGMLTGLFYAVLATDFHHENLIAAGDQPVPIDLETLFVPHARTLEGESERVAQRFLATVLQSLMLPSWHMSADRKTAFDISGIGSSTEDQDGGAGLTWVHINTDAMQFTSGRGTVTPSRNLPSLPGQSIDPGDFVPDVAEGFEQAYRGLMRHREDLLDSAGPLEAFRQCSSRLVLRATRTYAMLSRRALTPRLLESGIDRSLEFEGLGRALLAQSGNYEGSRVLRAEVDALEQLDIPYFDASTDSEVICGGNGVSARGILAGPSFDAVTARLRDLSEADLEYQAELIRASFAARNLNSIPYVASRAEITATETLSPAMLLAEGEAIAARIASRAIWQGDAAYWIGADYNHDIARYTLRPVGPSLYSGRGGIAVFLAALDAAGGDPEYGRLALGAARSVSEDWLSPAVGPETAGVLARAQGIGGAVGTASVVYSLVTTARLLRQPDLLEDALRISRFITPRDIAADEDFDVIGGAAGAILGLLPLWQETGDSTVRDRIVQCGEHLAGRQVKENGCAGGWKTRMATQPLTGFSHGAAGIAYALLQAHAATDNPAFRDAARRGLEYERSVFVPFHNNWPDFRAGGGFGGSWCHGAPGIGLARLGCVSYHPDAESHREIDTAIQWMQANPPNPSDHLCCGELGNLELLLAAGLRLGRADWVRKAQIRGAAALARAHCPQDGSPSGFQSNLGPCESIFMPGLFNGLAGIGYQMLRLAAPDRVPSVLLWE